MIRKTIFAAATIAAIGAAALIPTEASAGGGGKGGGGGGKGGGGYHHHHGHWGIGGLVLSTAVVGSCWRWVETRRGLARVYVCD
jgi:hypothetical protein